VLDLIDGLAKRSVVVEIAPDYDPSGSTTALAVQLLFNVIHRVLYHRF
jgi:agmatinase